MRFVVMGATGEYVRYAEMAITSIAHHHPEAKIVHMTQPGQKRIRLADETWISKDLNPADMPLFLRERFRMLADAGDEPTAVLDADTLTCRPLDDVWDYDFDIALAKRIHRGEQDQPYNSGVMLCRNAGFWRGMLERMDSNPRYRTWGGDQEGLAAEAKSGKWKFMELPGKEWNNYSCSKVNFPPARIVHYKGDRRKWMEGHFREWLWMGR